MKTAEKLREVAVQGYADAILCLASIEIVERSNVSAVLDRVNDSGAGRAARLFIDGALFRLHLFVTRAYAPVRYPGDLHLHAAINFLKCNPAVIDDFPAEKRRHFTEAVKLFERALEDNRLAKLKQMRDKLLAHWAEPDLSTPLPRYVELFGFTNETCVIWEHLSYGVGTVSIELVHQVGPYRDSANAFWSRWETRR